MDDFRSLRQRLQVHVAYARVFDDVLTGAELVARCGADGATAVEEALASLVDEGKLERMGEHYFLPGEADPARAAESTARRQRALKIVDDNRALLDFIGGLPWVRMLGISGSLAHGNAVDGPEKLVDIDLCLVVEPGSVHIVRLLVRVLGIVRHTSTVLGLRNHPARPCPNYVTEADFLEVTNPSFYTASDTVRMLVLRNDAEYARLLRANPWIGRYFAVVPEDDALPTTRLTRARARSMLNATCYGALAVGQWIKRRPRGQPSTYSLSFRFDREHSLRRSAPAGGGHQVTVARRFQRIYREHFGIDEELEAFLFPGTSSSSVRVGDVEAEPTLLAGLGYDE